MLCVLIEHLILLAKILIDAIIDDVPFEVRVADSQKPVILKIANQHIESLKSSKDRL
jgi:hypothetical protein